MGMPKTSTIQPQHGTRPLGRIEVLPHAIHTIAARAVCESYGVIGIAAPRLRNGEAVLLPAERSGEGIRVRIINDRLIIEVYIVLEYGLRMSEIAHNIMSSVKFSVEKMLGVPVQQVNVNIQGLGHSPAVKREH
jgi:uncharacterized alkaline shock family protein YloU